MEPINLTKTQEQFWILNKMYPGNTAYNIPCIFRIKGTPNIDFLTLALQQAVAKYNILRIRITEESGHPTQEIAYAVSDFLFETVCCPHYEINYDLPPEVLNEIHRPFNLGNDKLARAKLFISPKNGSFVTFVFHHIVVDLRSKEIFGQEFSKAYNALVSGEAALETSPVLSYFEYARWQKSWLASPDAQKMLDNWENELRGFEKPESLPSDYEEQKNKSLDGERLNFVFDENFSGKIRSFAQANLVSPFVALLSGFAVMLGRLGSQREATIGVPMTNRRGEGNEDCFGCFMNIVPVRVNLSEEMNPAGLIKQVRKKMMFAHRNQEMPFLSLVNEAGTKGNGASQLFKAGFTFEPPMELDLEGLETEPVLVEREGAQLELFLVFFEKGGKFYGTFEYSSSLYSRQTIARWKENYETLVGSMIANPGLPINELDIIPKKEWNLIKTWNDTNCPYENNLCIHQKFELQAASTPGNIALRFYGQTLTYAEFNVQANRLAHYLIDNGVRVEDKIGICIERSLEMMVAILATLKAGAAYVPINPEVPAERINVVAQDAGLKFILTSSPDSKNLGESPANIFIDEILAKNISEKITNPEADVKPHNLAYIIYTSGSTGKPKGVMVEHHSVMNKLGWMQKQYPLSQGESMLQKTPITFDVSVWELFWWMFSGGKLNILKPNGERDPKAIAESINEQKPAVLIFVPSVFSLILDYLSATQNEGCLTGIRWIVLIGEALPPTLVNRYNSLFNGRTSPTLINTYGPTEATVAVSWFECPKEPNPGKIFIGKPIANTKLFTVNEKNRVQPLGIPGELAIAGVNLARGYQGSPELTAQKFTGITLPDGKNIKVYKTGDLAKWDASGEIEFIGRTDNQVKIHGIRVELGDIESKIREHPDVSEAAVVVLPGLHGNKPLAGYIVPKPGAEGVAKEINQFLQKKLPQYMIPAVWVELGKMPLTTSGKIDRKVLPSPVFKSLNQFVAPTLEYEKQLAKIWKEILQLDEVGITDNFFESGGDSMLAITLATKIQKNFNITVDVIKVMEYPNIKSFAAYLLKLQKPQPEISIKIGERAALRKTNIRQVRTRLT
jgi:amino acid adenylation domain-containing protein